MDNPKEISVQSVSKARMKSVSGQNSFIGKYGELLWSAALLTAYQNGGFEELQYNYNNLPMKHMQLLLDAYRYKNTELELAIARAASFPQQKKKDGKKYMDELQNRLRGL